MNLNYLKNSSSLQSWTELNKIPEKESQSYFIVLVKVNDSGNPL